MAEQPSLGPELDSFLKSIKSIAETPDEALEEGSLQLIKENVTNNFSPAVREQVITQINTNMDAQHLTRVEAREAIDSLLEIINEMVYEESYTPKQKEVVEIMMTPVREIFSEAAERYHLYNIELPLTLAPGAQVPTYAHETDAAADLYALEDTKLAGYTTGNKIRTGVSIQLPEGWLALIIPRSSIGAKTGLRLSNSVGLIDSGYRGELGVLYDNLGEDYEIKQGDRIAQLLVMPSYRFQPKVVDILANSDRGEGGFGSTGT